MVCVGIIPPKFQHKIQDSSSVEIAPWVDLEAMNFTASDILLQPAQTPIRGYRKMERSSSLAHCRWWQGAQKGYCHLCLCCILHLKRSLLLPFSDCTKFWRITSPREMSYSYAGKEGEEICASADNALLRIMPHGSGGGGLTFPDCSESGQT